MINKIKKSTNKSSQVTQILTMTATIHVILIYSANILNNLILNCDLNDLVIKFAEMPNDLTLNEGQNAKFECRSTLASPRITWSKVSEKSFFDLKSIEFFSLADT